MYLSIYKIFLINRNKVFVLPSKVSINTLDLLEMKGPLLRKPYSKPLENGIFELRTKQELDITRVLYFFIIGKKAVLTNGFVKKSQKTPKTEKEHCRIQRKKRSMMHFSRNMILFRQWSCKSAAEYDTKRFIRQNRNYAGRYKPNWEWNKKSQPEYGEKTCTGIRDAIKAGICSDANKK